MKSSSCIDNKFYYLLLLFIVLLSTNAISNNNQHEVKDVVTEQAMVASAHPIESSVGIEILRQGGNAVDAAVALAFASSIAEPNASGIRGGGFMIVKMVDQDEAIMVDYRKMAPQKAASSFFYKTDKSFSELTEQGPNSIGVPGLAAGAELILEKYGSMKLEQILKPAISLVQNGIIVSEKLNTMITDNCEKIIKYPATTEIYLHEMLPLEPGAFLTNKDLAQTFEQIAHQGAKIFYEGNIATAIADEIKSHGGIFEVTDLHSYQAKIRKPVTGNYRGY